MQPICIRAVRKKRAYVKTVIRALKKTMLGIGLGMGLELELSVWAGLRLGLGLGLG